MHKKTPLAYLLPSKRRLVGGELGDSLGSLRDGVLRKLTRKSKSDSGLDLAGRKGLLLVVASELSGLSADSLEDVVDERVHDRHTSLGDSGLGVDLLEDLVDVRGVRLDSALSASGGGLLAALTGFLGRSFCHCRLLKIVEDSKVVIL